MSFPMTPTEQKTAARDFAAFWSGKGYEKGQTRDRLRHFPCMGMVAVI